MPGELPPLQVVQALLDAGADVDLQAQNGSAALHNAAGGGHESSVAAIIAAGADVDVQNSGGNTSLHLAASKGGPDPQRKRPPLLVRMASWQ